MRAPAETPVPARFAPGRGQLTLEQWFTPAFGLPAEETVLPRDVVHEETSPLGLRVPPRLEKAHDMALLFSVANRVRHWMERPPLVWTDAAGVRHVNVLGIAVYSVGTDGCVRARFWEVVDGGRCALSEQESIVSLDPVPLDSRFVGNWMVPLAEEVKAVVRRRGLDLSEAESKGWARWAISDGYDVASRVVDERAMRDRYKAALALDPALLGVARRLCQLQDLRFVHLDVYNKVALEADAHRKLAREAPELSVLLQVLRSLDGFPRPGEPLQRLRSFLLARGISPRGWRMVLRSRSGRLLPPMQSYRHHTLAAATLDHLVLLDRVGWSAAPRRQFTRELLATRLPARPGCGYSSGYRAEMPMLRRIARWFEADDTARDETTVSSIIGGLRLVLDMLELDEAQRARAEAGRPSWRTLRERAERWAEGRARAAQYPARWPTPDCEVVVEGHRVDWIDSPFALMREGMAMRHGVFDYVEKCAAGRVAAASIVRQADGRPVATLMVAKKYEHWVVSQLSGPANRHVELTVRIASKGLTA